MLEDCCELLNWWIQLWRRLLPLWPGRIEVWMSVSQYEVFLYSNLLGWRSCLVIHASLSTCWHLSTYHIGYCYNLPLLFLFADLLYLFFSCDYSSIPHHRPTDLTCLHNHFLPLASLDFFDSFSLTCMYFFAIPLHSISFYLLSHSSRLSQVSGI